MAAKSKKAGVELNPRLRQPGVIAATHYGVEDHGILTCSIQIEFDDHGSQGFGNLCLNPTIGPDFVKSVCETFSLSFSDDLQKSLKQMVGLRCFGLYCFGKHNESIEGLEDMVTGRRFLLTQWRRKHFPKKTPSPLEAARNELKSQIVNAWAVVKRAEAELKDLDNKYYDWEKA